MSHSFFFYKLPQKPESTKRLQKVLAGALLVLCDSRFMLMIRVYSFLWIIYFQHFGTILWGDEKDPFR